MYTKNTTKRRWKLSIIIDIDFSLSFNSQQLFECPPILEIEYCVNYRIQCWIHISKPGNEVDEMLRWTAGLAEWHNQIPAVSEKFTNPPEKQWREKQEKIIRTIKKWVVVGDESGNGWMIMKSSLEQSSPVQSVWWPWTRNKKSLTNCRCWKNEKYKAQKSSFSLWWRTNKTFHFTFHPHPSHFFVWWEDI